MEVVTAEAEAVAEPVSRPLLVLELVYELL